MQKQKLIFSRTAVQNTIRFLAQLVKTVAAKNVTICRILPNFTPVKTSP